MRYHDAGMSNQHTENNVRTTMSILESHIYLSKGKEIHSLSHCIMQARENFDGIIVFETRAFRFGGFCTLLFVQCIFSSPLWSKIWSRLAPKSHHATGLPKSDFPINKDLNHGKCIFSSLLWSKMWILEINFFLKNLRFFRENFDGNIVFGTGAFRLGGFCTLLFSAKNSPPCL